MRTVDPILEELLALILRMCGRAEGIIEKALRAIERRDAALAASVAEDDLEIDRLDVEIDEAVLKALALQAPVAEELRQVIAVKTMANDLERVGDLARNVASSAIRLAEATGFEVPGALIELGQGARRQLRMALDCFTERNPDRAREVLEGDDVLDEQQDRLVRGMLEAIEGDPSCTRPCVDVILVAESLERVGDHATNIAEDVILVAEAENVKHAEKLARG